MFKRSNEFISIEKKNISDSKELQSWIETINTTAASLSAPTLPMAVCSDSRKFKKEIFPVSHTKLSLVSLYFFERKNFKNINIFIIKKINSVNN